MTKGLRGNIRINLDVLQEGLDAAQDSLIRFRHFWERESELDEARDPLRDRAAKLRKAVAEARAVTVVGRDIAPALMANMRVGEAIADVAEGVADNG